MPELPEIESFKKYFESKASQKTVSNVDVNDEGVVEGSGRSFQMRMKDQTFQSVSRYGKYLFVKLSRDESLMFHFGMTGKFQYYKEDEEEPKYSRIIFNLDDGGKLAFVCRRKLGRVGLVDSKEDFIKEHELGPDAISLKWGEFQEAMTGRSGKVKSILMNQQIIAGIGNVYSDEILFQADIAPETGVDKLNEKELIKIFEKIKSVLPEVIKYRDKDHFPEGYLHDFRKEGEKCPKCGGEIVKATVGGRSAYYCRKHQKKK